MNAIAIQETSLWLSTGQMSYPEAVKRWGGSGVEHCHIDLIGMIEMHYSERGEMACTALAIENIPHIAPELWLDGVKVSFEDFWAGRIDYPQFLRLIMAAGVQSFAVYVTAGRILFMGRTGGFYYEDFDKGARRTLNYGELVTLVL